MPRGMHTWCGGKSGKGNNDGCCDGALIDTSTMSLGYDEGMGLTQKMVTINMSTTLFLFQSAYVLRMKKPE
jgi:hypothetical protein